MSGFLDAPLGEDVSWSRYDGENRAPDAGDPIEPARQFPAVEIAQTGGDHQKDLLGDVVRSASGPPSAESTADLIEPFVIDPFEIRHHRAYLAHRSAVLSRFGPI